MVDVKTAEDIFKRLKRKPVVTLALLFAVVAIAAGGAWLLAYLSESGRQAAAPTNSLATLNSSAAAAPTGSSGTNEQGPPAVDRVDDREGSGVDRQEVSDPSNTSASATLAIDPTNPSHSAAQNTPERNGELRFNGPAADRRRLVTIEQITYGTGSHRNVINIAVRNRTNGDVVLRSVRLTQWETLASACNAPNFEILELSNLAAIYSGVSSMQVTGSFRDPRDPEFRYRLAGRYETSCSERSLSLSMDISASIAAGEVQLFRIIFPNRLLITSVRSSMNPRNLATGQTAEIRLNGFRTLYIEILTSAGSLRGSGSQN